MKLILSNVQKRYLNGLYSSMSVAASQDKERELSRVLRKLSEKFTPNATFVNLNMEEVDLTSSVVTDVITEMKKIDSENLEINDMEELSTELISLLSNGTFVLKDKK